MSQHHTRKRRRTLPCIRLLFFLVAGILLYDCKNLPPALFFIPLLLLCTAVFTGFSTGTFFRFYNNVIYGLTIASFLVCTGFYLARINDIRNHPDWIGVYTDSSWQQWAGILETGPSRKPHSYQATLRIKFIIQNNQLQPATGFCLVYFRLSDSLKLPQPGDLVCFRDKPREIRSQQIPGAFDYAAYCSRKNLYHQLFADSNGYRVLNIPEYSNRKSASLLFAGWQEQLSIMLRQRMTDPQAAGMAAALLVGFKAELDPELAQTYAATGVSHVIAISGMHLGLIYWLITVLLAFLPIPGRLFWIKPLAAILGIWAFSLLTGAGPSVLRAAVMFSFLSGEQFFRRKIPSLNGLAASALVLLCINPGYLYDAGFLLSYAAVLSLLLFYQPVYQLFFFKKKAADLIWKAAAVTLAAQLVTVPVSLYLFHQFPVYFLPANLIAVPLSTILLFIAIGVEVFYGLPLISGGLGLLLEKGIRFMNSSMQFIEQIPGALWMPLQVSLLQVGLLYLVLAGIYRYWIGQQRKAIWLVLAAVLVSGLVRISTFRENLNQQVLVIYPERQQDAADFFSGTTAFQLDTRDTTLSNGRLACRRHFRSTTTDTLLLRPFANRYVDLGPFALLQLNGPLQELPPQASRKPCILWLCGGARTELPPILNELPHCQVVIGSTVSRKLAARWIQDCREKGIPCHHLVDKGAFVMPLQ